jgi:ABC-type uncharacterized transport system YnjBCD ATPase subunit
MPAEDSEALAPDNEAEYRREALPDILPEVIDIEPESGRDPERLAPDNEALIEALRVVEMAEPDVVLIDAPRLLEVIWLEGPLAEVPRLTEAATED